MNVEPQVTIAIPTYNRANGYLKQAIASAVNQTYQNIEIIVADNCSTDHTEAVVATFTDPRIRYFKQPQNIGANNNFNFCIDQARGTYFLLLHDDDLIDPDFVETCLDRAAENPGAGIICTGVRIIDAQGQVKREVLNRAAGLSTEAFFRAWFTPQVGLFLCSTMFNTKHLKEIGGFKSKHNLYQDVVAEFQLAAKFGRVDVKEVRASFRNHEAAATFAAKIKDWCDESLQLLDLMCELAPESRAALRTEGMSFFARRNYKRAKAIKSPLSRLAAYFVVFRKFNFQYPPPTDLILSRRFLYGNARPVYEENGIGQ